MPLTLSLIFANVATLVILHGALATQVIQTEDAQVSTPVANHDSGNLLVKVEVDLVGVASGCEADESVDGDGDVDSGGGAGAGAGHPPLVRQDGGIRAILYLVLLYLVLLLLRQRKMSEITLMSSGRQDQLRTVLDHKVIVVDVVHLGHFRVVEERVWTHLV